MIASRTLGDWSNWSSSLLPSGSVLSTLGIAARMLSTHRERAASHAAEQRNEGLLDAVDLDDVGLNGRRVLGVAHVLDEDGSAVDDPYRDVVEAP